MATDWVLDTGCPAGLHTSREPKTVGDTLGDVEAKEVLLAMADAPVVVEARTIRGTQGDV